MKILITGGAGYIGSYVSQLLLDQGHSVWILDDLSSGYLELIPSQSNFLKGSILDFQFLESLFSRNKFDVVMHLAAKKSVTESFQKPELYFKINTNGTHNLIKLSERYGVKHFIFSSTAAVYSNPGLKAVSENDPTDPLSPYGKSKLKAEQHIIQNRHLKFAVLRYFNVAGANLEIQKGDMNPNATNLFKMVAQAALGISKSLKIYGNKYPTHDGTGVRDFIHVGDVANIHLKVLDYLNQGGQSEIFNCGYNQGSSVLEIVKGFEDILGKTIPIEFCPSREGDLAQVVCDTTKLKNTLNWVPHFYSLEALCRSTLDWEKYLLEQNTTQKAS